MEKLFTMLPKELTDKLQQAETAQQAQAFYAEKMQEAKYMFGYPAYHYALSPLTQYLLLMHYTSPFSNNCGDIDERGNYAMDTKQIEKKIVGLYAEKFGMGDNFWGYITSGGSESNSCGIVLAFEKNPKGLLYYSQAAHYSVEKYAATYPCVKIPSLGKDQLDVGALLKEIQHNYDTQGMAANIVLTHGTTKYGECDDVDTIVAYLREKKIPYYIHVDAALFGGIQNNQEDAPLLMNAKARGIDSVSVSLHKYVGFPDVKSVFVAVEKPRGRSVAYIGQNDTTVSGSRSIPAFALYQHLLEQLSEPATDTYRKNIVYFEGLLQAKGVAYYRAPLSNIFVIDCPSEEICRRFQLSCFDENEGGRVALKAHIIIFPSHGKQEMDELANSLTEK